MKDQQVNTHQKKNFRPNKLKLNEFHQIKQKKTKKINPKKKLRDLERLLKNPKLDPEYKAEREKEIEGLKKEVEKSGKENEKKQRKLFFLDQKYKKVKNIEKIKVRRLLKKVKKALEESQKEGKDTKQIEIEKNDLVEKLNYIKFFPKDKKYISIFTKEKNENAEKMRQGITNSIKTMLSKVKQQKYSLSKPKKEDLNLPHPERRVKKADPFFIEESELEKIDIKSIKKKIVDKSGRIIKEDQ